MQAGQGVTGGAPSELGGQKCVQHATESIPYVQVIQLRLAGTLSDCYLSLL